MLPLTGEVTVRGWVQTRRDSKAGISFLAVYDGFHSLILYRPSLIILCPITMMTFCTLTMAVPSLLTGVVVASPGSGPEFRNSGPSAIEVTGWVEVRTPYPMAAKTSQHQVPCGEVAHLRPRTNLIGAVARVIRWPPGAASLLR